MARIQYIPAVKAMMKPLAVFFILIGSVHTMQVKAADSHHVLVELFTSQGCSSCTPVDELLGKMATEEFLKKAVVLSWHIKIWDQIGWKDTFAADWNLDRHKNYARMENEKGLGTPQFVVANKFIRLDNKLESNLKNSVLADAGRELQFGIDVDARLKDQKIVTSILLRNLNGKVPIGKDVHVIAVLYEKSVETACNAGENKGRKLKQFFVALKTMPPKPASEFLEKAVTLTFEAPKNVEASNLGIAVLVEDTAKTSTLECKTAPVVNP